MIIIKLKGGLGNQLFQYAFGRRIAIDNNLPLKLDIVSGYNNDFYKRLYRLKHFNIQAEIASTEDLNKAIILQSPSIIGKSIRFASRFRPYYKNYVVKELHYFFDTNVLRPNKNVYFDGYWQSERYFIKIKDIILKEFTVKYPFNGINLAIANKIQATNSVCIHIRRNHGISTDGKVDINAVENIYGQVSLNYYYDAVKYLSNKFNNMRFFVFSDNPEWAKRNLKLSYPTQFISHNIGKEYEDLRLISLCKHNIIANSTFSWWGAWLSTNPNKIVIAPKNWVNDNYMSIQNKDLFPQSWILFNN